MAKQKQTKTEKAIDKRIETAYRQACSGIVINIMDIEKVFTFGKALINENPNEDDFRKSLREYVKTLEC